VPYGLPGKIGWKSLKLMIPILILFGGLVVSTIDFKLREINLSHSDNETLSYLQGISLPLTQNLTSDREKAIVLCNWTHNHLKFGVRPYDIDYYQPIEVLTANQSTCGGFSVVLASLCISIGMEARVVGLVSSNQEGHMITEVLVDDHWAVFDPTYNAYYEGNGTLPSAWELHNNPQISIDPSILRSYYEGRIYVKYSERYDDINYILFMHDHPSVWMNNYNIGILYGNATLPLHTEFRGSGLLITLMVWLLDCRVRLAFPIVPNVVLIILVYCIFHLLSSKGVDRSRNTKQARFRSRA